MKYSEWKTSNQGKGEKRFWSNILCLFWRLVEIISKNSAAILGSGFRKCGINPINVNELLSWLPRRQCDRHAIYDSFINSLRAKRDKNVNCKKKRKNFFNPQKNIVRCFIQKKKDKMTLILKQLKELQEKTGWNTISSDEESSEINIRNLPDNDLQELSELAYNNFDEVAGMLALTNTGTLKKRGSCSSCST